MRKKKGEDRIEKAYRETCSGVQINVMDIGKIYTEGNRLISAGADDEALRIGIKSFVETLRKN